GPIFLGYWAPRGEQAEGWALGVLFSLLSFPTRAPDYDRSMLRWNVKFKLGLTFPCRGAGKGRARAILRYIAAAKHTFRVDILSRTRSCNACNCVMIATTEFVVSHPKYLEQLPEKLSSTHTAWFAGDKDKGGITFVDFLAYDVLDMKRIFEPSCLDSFPNLKDFISRFEPGIPPRSFFGTTATWNST
uniref:glutathione transferase n=1 Tax=Rhinopithecus bieti TaxID=61621 RepID=A0A2K6MH89_RHIBE